MNKVFKTRDAATAALRKLGTQKADYNFFIEKGLDGYYHVNMDAAERHLSERAMMAANGVKVTRTVVVEGEVTVRPSLGKAPKPSHQTGSRAAKAAIKAAADTDTITSVAIEAILAGYTNAEVFKILKARFGLDDDKKSYPAWYRGKLRREGKLVEGSEK